MVRFAISVSQREKHGRVGLGDAVHTGVCSTVFRRFGGRAAEELAVLCRPEGRSLDAAEQAESAYRALAAFLADHRAGFRDLTSETLFLRDVRRDVQPVLDARGRILAHLGESPGAPAPALILQAPVEAGASFELAAAALLPYDRETWSVRDIRRRSSCGCEGCMRSGARLVRLDAQESLYTANVYGAGDDAIEQVSDMFVAAERLLEQCGMDFRNVVRTWIHLRDIDRDYDALNEARRRFFLDRGIEPRPASTAVQGAPFPDAHDFSIRLHAVKSSPGVAVTPISTPLLNEAWTYGVDFSRGVKLADSNKLILDISGTASIDEEGRTIHAGNFEAQAGRMLDNIASLLGGQGAAFEDLFSAVVYLRSAGDAAALRSICRTRGFEGFPCAVVEAPLCRPDLLCEAEAVALLPLAPSGA